MRNTFLLLTLAYCLAASAYAAGHIRGTSTNTAASNTRPIIGILSLPNYENHYENLGQSYFPASYVKWVESGGARVVPIPYTLSEKELRERLSHLNGVLFTGGAADFSFANKTLTPYGRAGQIIFEEVVRANQAGEYFPLWGTCLGFEFISVLASGPNFAEPVLVSGFDSENITLPLHFTTDAPSSRMFTFAKERNVYDIFSNQPVTMNNHGMGVPPEKFMKNSNLTSMFRILSTNYDRHGREFVSTMEAIHLPIYATQWHPEKVQFEWWAREVINHSFDSVHANSVFAFWLANEARKNTRSFNTPGEEAAALIYNYEPVYTAKYVPGFEQCYFFK